jgi:hypothetical protein
MNRTIASALLFIITNASTVNAQTTSVQGTGSYLNYPMGTRIYNNGALSIPNGPILYPSVTGTNNDGSSTYYYANGTRIHVNPKSMGATGTMIVPKTVDIQNINPVPSLKIQPQIRR